MKYYTYLLIDPRDCKPFYVGKGTGDRMYAHLRDASDTPKVSRILDITRNGHNVEFEQVAFFASEVDAYEAEKALIRQYGRDNLTNLNNGGGGIRDEVLTDEESLVDSWAKVIRKTKGLTLYPVLRLCGQEFPIPMRVIRSIEKRAVETISKLGLQRSNEIASRYNVNFVF